MIGTVILVPVVESKCDAAYKLIIWKYLIEEVMI